MDLMGGCVVHAKRGDRQAYQPLQSSRVAGCAPDAVADALIALTSARRLYIADLDAIRGQASHAAVVGELARRHPEVEIWLDAGFVDAEAALAVCLASGVRPVLGSESLTDPAAFRLLAEAGLPAVLSLDHRNGQFMGAAWLQDPAVWPERVIAMELARVGSGEGPALDLMRRLSASRPDVQWVAAGGVRGADDLAVLAREGVAAVLVASALHDGRLP